MTRQSLHLVEGIHGLGPDQPRGLVDVGVDLRGRTAQQQRSDEVPQLQAHLFALLSRTGTVQYMVLFISYMFNIIYLLYIYILGKVQYMVLFISYYVKYIYLHICLISYKLYIHTYWGHIFGSVLMCYHIHRFRELERFRQTTRKTYGLEKKRMKPKQTQQKQQTSHSQYLSCFHQLPSGKL